MQRPTTQLRTYNCPNCAAPLELIPNVDTLQCRYCHNSIQVRRPNAPPPPVPVEQRFVLHIPQDYTADYGSVARANTVVSLVITAIVIVAAVIPGLVIGLRSSGISLFNSGLPATCGVNGRMTISGQTFTKGGVALNAETNCKVTIKNSKIKGSLDLGNNVEVEISDSEITGDDEVIKTEANVKIRLTNTTINATSLALASGINTELTMNGSKIITKGIGIRSSVNLKVTLKNSEVRAGENAIDAESNPVVYLDEQSSITGGDAALHLPSNGEINCKGKITAEGIGIFAGNNGKLKINKGCVVKGKTYAIDADTNLNLTLDGKLESEGTAIQCEHADSISINPTAAIDAPIAWPAKLKPYGGFRVSPKATISSAGPNAMPSVTTCTAADIAARKPGCK